jgi:hypothetical protein
VKPGDHPEFFRLPPPPGRSRESSIRLDREGRFFHDGELVRHPGMARAFASWLARHPDDGRYILQNGYDWTYLHVEDTPFFVESVRVEPEGFRLLLSDGSEEPLEPRGVAVRGGALVAAVKGGAFEARFLRGAQLALGEYLDLDDAGRPLLRLPTGPVPLGK